jgi:hypothetical protein
MSKLVDAIDHVMSFGQIDPFSRRLLQLCSTDSEGLCRGLSIY